MDETFESSWALERRKREACSCLEKVRRNFVDVLCFFDVDCFPDDLESFLFWLFEQLWTLKQDLVREDKKGIQFSSFFAC